MSDETTYTMYRSDARGKIEIDLNDPAYSLEQLIEKARAVYQEKDEKLASHQGMVKFYEGQAERAMKTLIRLEKAHDAVRKALGPGERELNGS